MTARTPEWLVERLHAGELPPAEAEAVRARLAAEGGLARLDALAADDRAFLVSHPPTPALAEIRRRAGVKPPRRAAPGWLAGVGVAAVAAALVAGVTLPRAARVAAPWGFEEGEDRVKGLAPGLLVHRARAGAAPEPLADGAAAHAGDALQLSYVAAGARYGVVVSIDGRGGVTRHLPEEGEVAAALQAGGAVALPHAYQLDDAPGYERFFLVTAPAPFDVAVVVEAARHLAATGRARQDPLVLPGGLAQRPVLLVKR